MKVDPSLFAKASTYVVRAVFASTPDYTAIELGAAPGWAALIDEPGAELEKSLDKLREAPELELPTAGACSIVADLAAGEPFSIVRARELVRAGVLSGWSRDRVKHIVAAVRWVGLIKSKREPFAAMHSSSGAGALWVDRAMVQRYFPRIDFANRAPVAVPREVVGRLEVDHDLDAWSARVHSVEPTARTAAWLEMIRYNLDAKRRVAYTVAKGLHDPRYTNMPLFHQFGGVWLSRDPSAAPNLASLVALYGFAKAPAAGADLPSVVAQLLAGRDPAMAPAMRTATKRWLKKSNLG